MSTSDSTQEPSAFIKSISKSREEFATRFEILQQITRKCSELGTEDLPPLYAIQKIGSDTEQHFKQAMIVIFSELYLRFKLTRSSKVFDLGCGSGRMAYPFAYLLTEGGVYYGADVWEEGIEICKNRFQLQNFHFNTIDVNNNYYFDKFKDESPNNFTLPFLPSGELELVFAISVFTHLIEDDARAYLREFKRVLKSNGCAYVTCFIIDRFFKEYAELTNTYTAVKEVSPGHYQAYEGQDFFGAYTLPKWQEMVSDAGLEIVSFGLGSWANKPGSQSHQDFFILMHKS